MDKGTKAGRKEPAVVVGVDGSEGSKQALLWALDEARLRKQPLRVVHAWLFGYIGGSIEGYPYRAGSASGYTSLGVDLGDLHRRAEGLLERAIADAGAATEDVKIERQVVQGHASEVLIGAVVAGDLLVVGSRGHGSLTGLLVGSVSQQCVHHAPCPVVVVHAPK